MELPRSVEISVTEIPLSSITVTGIKKKGKRK
jgi:hypothetical protein